MTVAPPEVIAKHIKIYELKQQGMKLTEIAKQTNSSYGSVLYVLYRKYDYRTLSN
jgi:orotate phosphoribosyltransferase-like protein